MICPTAAPAVHGPCRGTSTSRAPRMARATARPPNGPHHLVGQAVHDHGGRGDLPVVARAGCRCPGSRRTAGRRRRVVAAVVAFGRVGADAAPRAPGSAGLPMIRVTRTALSMITSTRRTRRRALDDREQGPRRRRRQERLVVAGEDHRQRDGPRGVPRREDLRDHPAHRGADDVGAVDAQVVEHRGGVVGHVLQRVHRRAAACRGTERTMLGISGPPTRGRRACWTGRRRGCRSG